MNKDNRPPVMQIEYSEIELKKRYPLRISRGEYSGSINLFVTLNKDGHTGLGECAPGKTTGASTATECQQQLEDFIANFDLANASPYDSWQAARAANVAPCAYAGLDIAWWDWLAKQASMPLYRLLGFSNRNVATSVTIGIVPPDVARERVPEIISRTGARYLKVKLGSPDGIDADQTMLNAVSEVAKSANVGIRVDANGGWSLEDAKTMMTWLAQQETEYVEQPLSHTCDDQLPELFSHRPLPIYVDESCNFKTDVARLAHTVDGVNLKLMKCGGITEALAIVATARAHELKTMIGCMGESSVSISAGAAIGSLFDYIDLDSQLNLLPDPAEGAVLRNGIVTPTDDYGHGGRLKC
jgi:L-alanine-DL-glutamate epimerase-like enolase superfamily enzyme